jgi:spore germination protein KC
VGGMVDLFKKMGMFLFLFMLISTLLGCGDYMEIDRISFPGVLGVDYHKEDENIHVFAQVSVQGEGGGGGSEFPPKEFKVMKGEGKTLMEAMSDMIDKNTQSISWKHVHVVVLAKNLAEQGVINEIDLLFRFEEILVNAYLMITNEDLEELLGSSLKIQSSLPFPLVGLHLISKQSTHTRKMTVREFIMAYLKDGEEAFVPTVSILEKEEDEITFHFNHIGVFKKDQLVGELTEEDGAIFSFLKEYQNESSILIPYEGNGKESLMIDAISSKIRMKPFMGNGEIGMRIQADVKFNISQHDIDRKLSVKEVDQLNRAVEKHFKENSQKFIKKLQKEFQSDLLGFGEKVYRKYPKFWIENKGDWDVIFPKVAVIVEVKAKMENTGQIINSFETLKSKN